MDFNEYQKLAMRTSPDGHDRIMNGCLGLIGETGEVIDTIKKYMFQSGSNSPMPADKLVDECGDVLWYCAELCTGYGKSLNEAVYFAQPGFGLFVDKYRERLPQNMVHVSIELVREVMRTVDDETEKCHNVKWMIRHIGQIVLYIDFFLSNFRIGTLAEAMERNIEKLRKRYPDGFDPERSMNRPEYQSDKDREEADAARRLLETLDKSE